MYPTFNNMWDETTRLTVVATRVCLIGIMQPIHSQEDRIRTKRFHAELDSTSATHFRSAELKFVQPLDFSVLCRAKNLEITRYATDKWDRFVLHIFSSYPPPIRLLFPTTRTKKRNGQVWVLHPGLFWQLRRRAGRDSRPPAHSS